MRTLSQQRYLKAPFCDKSFTGIIGHVDYQDPGVWLVMTSSAPPEDVADWYLQSLIHRGWKKIEEDKTKIVFERYPFPFVSRQELHLIIGVSHIQNSSETSVQLSITDLSLLDIPSKLMVPPLQAARNFGGIINMIAYGTLGLL